MDKFLALTFADLGERGDLTVRYWAVERKENRGNGGSMDSIPWTLYHGLYTMDSIPWTPYHGLTGLNCCVALYWGAGVMALLLIHRVW